MGWDRREYDRQRYHKRRAETFKYLGDVCSECKSDKDLQVHHIDPNEKSFTLGATGWTRPWDKVVEELSKCKLLCADCHKSKHKTEHGKRRMYMSGCRCDACREAQRVYNREYKRRKRASVSVAQVAER